jgi:hypothetical protein
MELAHQAGSFVFPEEKHFLKLKFIVTKPGDDVISIALI